MISFFLPAQVETAPIEKAWLGNWEFTETWRGPQDTTKAVVSTIRIVQKGSQLSATLEQDGFQTYRRLEATVDAQGQAIRLRFRPTSKTVGGDRFKAGEVLIELRRTANCVITIWHAIEPVLDVNKQPGAYFAKP